MNQEGLFQKAWQITKMPARDVRYKVTADDVKRMQQLSEQGMGQAAIARLLQEEGLPVSTGIVHYWVNEASRNAQRLKNAKRRYVAGSAENQARIERDAAKRKKNWKVDDDMRLRHAIQSAKDEKRSKRRTVEGISMSDAEKLLSNRELTRPNSKIDEDLEL
jgi:hypothetical protein